MAKLTLSDVGNLAQLSAVSTINSNNANIEAAIENTLSRDGTIPNQMNADIDLNSYDLLNVGLLDAQDVTIDGQPVEGVLTAAIAAANAATASAIAADNSADSAALSAASAAISAEIASSNAVVNFTTVAQLLADTTMGYGAFTVPVVTGQVVEAQGFRYEIAASAASDHHVTTAGGVKLYYRTNSSFYVTAFGILGDGTTDETVIIQKAADVAAAAGKWLMLDGGVYIVSTLTFATSIEIGGKGTLRKKAGTTGRLILANANLKIHGDITLDQNKANCPNGSATAFTDTTISHTGAILDLSGVTLPAAVSVNIRATTTQLMRLTNCTIYGGWMNVSGSFAGTAKVEIIGGVYYGSTADDGIQVLNSPDVLIEGVEAYGSYRSNIVLATGTKNFRIANCYSHDAQNTGAQGGWGIVCSTSVNHGTIVGNVCRNNGRGPCTIDVYDPGVKDAHIEVTGNDFDAEYSGGYGVSGLVINGARYVSVTGNRIRKASQHILATSNLETLIAGNTFEDCGTGYFALFTDSSVVKFSGNIMRTCSNVSGAVLDFRTCTYLDVTDNQITDINGASRSVFRISDCSDFNIVNNYAQKTDTGTGFCFLLTGVLSRGRLRANRFYSAVAAWQYYIQGTGTTITDVGTNFNEISVPGVTVSPNRYILAATLINADSDSFAGVKNSYSAAPTMFTPLTGSVAMIAGAVKGYNGAAWV